MFKQFILWGILALLVSCSAPKQKDAYIESRLSALLESKDFFQLEKELNLEKDKLPEDRFLFYKVFCDQAFNRRQQANESTDILLANYKAALCDSALVKLLSAKADNYVHSFQYKKAAETYAQILADYKNVLDSADLANYENVRQLFAAVQEVRPQQITLPGGR